MILVLLDTQFAGDSDLKTSCSIGELSWLPVNLKLLLVLVLQVQHVTGLGSVRLASMME